MRDDIIGKLEQNYQMPAVANIKGTGDLTEMWFNITLSV